MLFEKSSSFPVSIERLFAFHESATALERLLPPNQKVEILKRSKNLQIGQQVVLKMTVAPFIHLRWLAEHTEYLPPRLFADKQVKGPFAKWYHRHSFQTVEQNESILTDSVEFQVSKFAFLDRALSPTVRKQIQSMFDYRHRLTKHDVELATKLNAHGKTLIVSGATGFIGQRVVALARSLGIRVKILKRVHSLDDVTNFRSQPSEDSSLPVETPWHVETGTVKLDDWHDIDAIIHLAGKNIAAKRWSKSHKEDLRTSRVDSTKRLVQFLQQNKSLPGTWVTASGLGIYPDSGDQLLTEDTPHAEDFLGTLAQDWEQASACVQEHGSRWCAARLSMVMDPMQGALVPLLWQFKLFAGGRLGNGRMFWSWVERDDAASAFLWLAFHEQCSGAYNITGQAVTNAEFSKTLATVLHRPNLIPAPTPMIRLALGEMADGLLLRSNRGDNSKLLQSGYPMRFPTLEPALQHLLS